MVPAYFPFTTVAPDISGLLETFPGPVVLYRPSGSNLPDHLARTEIGRAMDIRIPVGTDAAELEGMIRDFRQWARDHQGSETFWFAAGTGADTFHGDTATSGIVGDLRRRRDGRARTAPSDPLLAARLFLEIAQQRDEQQWEIRRDLARVEILEEKLFRQLRPDGDPKVLPASSVFTTAADPGRAMIDERMACWARLYGADAGERPRWFLTDSREAVDWLLERFAESTAAAGGAPLCVPMKEGSGRGPGAKQALNAFVAALAGGGEEGLQPPPEFSCDRCPPPCWQVFFYRVTGSSPDRFVRRWLDGKQTPLPGKDSGDGQAVFAWIRPVDGG